MDLKGSVLNGLNLSGTLSSPANLRMMSPAKSARRSGAWYGTLFMSIGHTITTSIENYINIFIFIFIFFFFFFFFSSGNFGMMRVQEEVRVVCFLFTSFVLSHIKYCQICTYISIFTYIHLFMDSLLFSTCFFYFFLLLSRIKSIIVWKFT